MIITPVRLTCNSVLTETAYRTTPSKESDVYSYGVVLLELITRKRAVDPLFNGEIDIVGWVRSAWGSSGEIESIVDPGLVDEMWDVAINDQIINVLLLALRCTEKELSRRPSMRDVVKQLEDVNK